VFNGSKKKNNKNQLVTVIEGSGFIGSHVADQLIQKGYPVRIFDWTDSPSKVEGQKMIFGDLQNKYLLKKE
jgi:nucleoside-diphosphate-sugar epimerase